MKGKKKQSVLHKSEEKTNLDSVYLFTSLSFLSHESQQQLGALWYCQGPTHNPMPIQLLLVSEIGSSSSSSNCVRK
jgi:hypothetical protein